MIPGVEVREVIDRLLSADPEVRGRVLGQISPRDATVVENWVKHRWDLWARPKQLLPPGDWRYAIFMCGRSWGKTRTGAEAVRAKAESGQHAWISVIGPTVGSLLRDMVGGPSGILSISPPWFQPQYQPSRSQLIYPPHPITWIRTRVALLSADKPSRIRGSQCSFAWLDEPQTWTNAEEALDMVDLTLRLGERPQCVVTLTPYPNVEVAKRLALGPKGVDGTRALPRSVVVVRGSTFENTAIDPEVLGEYRRRYEGTRRGLQELEAEILDRPENELFTREMVEKARVDAVPPLRRVVLAVDPSRSRWGAGDMAGGCVAGLGEGGTIYVFADVSKRGSPAAWVKHFSSVYNRHSCDLAVYEANRLSPDLVAMILAETRGQRWEPRTATEKKGFRLEPVAAAMDKGLVKLAGTFEVDDLGELVDQMVGFDRNEPKGQVDDRLDAFGWAVLELLELAQKPGLVAR